MALVEFTGRNLDRDRLAAALGATSGNAYLRARFHDPDTLGPADLPPPRLVVHHVAGELTSHRHVSGPGCWHRRWVLDAGRIWAAELSRGPGPTGSGVCSVLRHAPATVDERLGRLVDADPGGPWTLAGLRELRRIYVASLDAVASFDHPGYLGDITFLRHRGALHFLPTLHDDMTEFWTRYCLGRLTVHDVDGTHFDCLTGAHAARVATLLRGGWGRS